MVLAIRCCMLDLATFEAPASSFIPSSWLVSVDFDGGEIDEAIVTWCDADDVEHVTKVEIVIERHGYGRGASFTCDVVGDLPLPIAHTVAEKAENRAANDWGV